MVSTAYKCLKYYQYVNIDKLRPPGGGSGDLAFGSAIHAALEAALRDEDAMSVFQIYWETEREKALEYSRFGWEPLKQMGERMVSLFQRLHRKHFQVNMLEERLYGTLEGYAVEGTPDFVGLYKGVPSVVDFKTSAQQYTQERAVSNEQMYLYAHLVIQQKGFIPEQVVYFPLIKQDPPRIQTPVIQPFGPDTLQYKLANFVQMLKELDKRQEAGVYLENRNSCVIGSRRCEFFERCHGKN